MQEILNLLLQFVYNTGFALVHWGNLVMIVVAVVLLYLGVAKHFEPFLLVPIGFGVLVGNIPFFKGFGIGVYETGSVLNYLYWGVGTGIYPSVIFLGIGAMTDFRSLLATPRLMVLGAAAQAGIFITLLGAMYLGFAPNESAAIAIIGGADGPTSIFLTAKLAPYLMGPIAIAAYSYMALIPIIQPPIMRLLTTHKERCIVMEDSREVVRKEMLFFPVVAVLLSCFVAPTAMALLGPLFLGNFMKESRVVDRLTKTASTAIMDVATILLGFTVGCSTQADVFLTSASFGIFCLGAFAFCVSTACGVLGAKLMNLVLPEGKKINPLLGASGVSALPGSPREVHIMGLKANPNNYLMMYGMACASSAIIGSAVVAGLLWTFYGV